MTQRQHSSRSALRGFTIIELMIAVAIIAILAAVALPSYQDYIRRGQLPEAFTSLSDYRVKMEQYYQDNRNYGTGACATGASSPTWNNFVPGGARYFTYGCTLDRGGQGFTVTATGSGGSAVGNVYKINDAGKQFTTQFKGKAVSSVCWLARGSECPSS